MAIVITTQTFLFTTPVSLFPTIYQTIFALANILVSVVQSFAPPELICREKDQHFVS